ncbi:MAG: methyl-accepting chemotaxis sensory transducer [Tardiphaga sp.]|nr:methyl-accepting chemotaxis sensory transducer [Tardiphaga sp.]
MPKFKSISIRIMVAISLVAAASCAALAIFGLWRQHVTIEVALDRELRSDYVNIVGALESEMRSLQAVGNALAALPQLKTLMRQSDRSGIIAMFKDPLKDIAPLGIELLSIHTPPGTAFARVHAPDKFGDDVTARRKMVVEMFATQKPVSGIEAGREALNIFGLAPVFDGNTLLGTIDMGAPFGTTFVNAMKKRFAVDIAIHQIEGDAVRTLASTFSGATKSKDAIQRALNGEKVIVTGEQNGRPTATAYGSISNFSGQPVAVFEIVRDVSAYRALERNSLIWLASGALAAVLIAALIAAWLGRGMAKPILALEDAMRQMIAGNHEIRVSGAARSDEIGSMARAVDVFRNSLLEANQLRAAHEHQRIATDEDRRATLHALAAKFESGVGNIVNAVGSAATDLRTTAETMAVSAEQAVRQTTSVAAASDNASQNAEAVAAAVEELNASIHAIAQQVNDSANITGAAVTQANETNGEIQGLAIAAQKIGDVVKLISEIAEQTNLLALNATIEAARAGDAGRGFAVVASEVKALASQTSKATSDIAAQVDAIQAATRSSADAIEGITRTINRVNDIASMIAASVEEQGAATREIAQNVTASARGSSEVSHHIAGVNDTARQTGIVAGRVVEAASDLSNNGAELRAQVETFLREVRAA